MNIQDYFYKALTAAVLTAFLTGCSSQAENRKVEKSEFKDKQNFETFRLEKQIFDSQLQIPGELVAFQQVDLYAKVTSYVKELMVDIGSEVKAGQLLVSLEAPELNTQLLAAESRLKAQEAISIASKANYNRLLQTSKTPGTISQNDLEQASAKANSDLAQLEAAKAAFNEVSVMKNYLQIRAPFDGVISARNVNPGAYVGPSGKGSEFPVFTLQQQNKLRLVVSIPEAFTGYLKNEDEVEFKVRSYPGETFKAKVKRKAGALDLKLRSERVEMDVVNDNKKLLPGTIAEVILKLSSKDSSFVIPKSALVNSAEGTFIIKSVNRKAEYIDVKKGRQVNDTFEIFGSLKVGDTIVTKASEELRRGDNLY